MAFVADDLGAWLIGLLADAGRRKLITLVFGTDQERALHRVAMVAVQLTAAELGQSGAGQAGQLAMVVSEVFRGPMPEAPLAAHATLLEALHAGIADRLAVLDDAALTGTAQSSAEVLGVPGRMLAETLARYLVREIMLHGSSGSPLAPLADQLNHDMTHLQGQRLEGILGQLADHVMTLGPADLNTATRRPTRLAPRPALLAGREELLEELDQRLSAGDGLGPRIVVLCGLGGGKDQHGGRVCASAPV